MWSKFWNRSWWIKGPVIVLVVFVALVIIGALAGGDEEPSTADDDNEVTATARAGSTSGATDTPEPTETSEPTATPTAAPGIGSVVEVGDLDLTVVSAGPISSAQHNMFNTANFAVQVKATNARGGTYNINPFYFKLVDAGGVARDPSFSCAGCPPQLEAVELREGATIEGALYFELPAGTTASALFYQALLSTNSVEIPLQ